MNNSLKRFFSNLSYSISSNLLSMLISTVVLMLLPKVLGVGSYGYFQLYVFYTQYVGFLHFGLVDGIYVRYGGQEYQNLEKNKLFSQFWLLLGFEIVLSGLGLVLFTNIYGESNNLIVIFYTLICSIIVISRGYLLYLLQATNRIHEYAISTVIEKIIYLFIALSIVAFSFKSYQVIIIGDLIGKLFSLAYAVVVCRDLVFRKIDDFKISFKEIYLNVSVGIKVTFAYISGMLIIGIIRFAIKKVWSIEMFGQISLTLSISNLMLIFVNAIGLVIFPTIKRMKSEKVYSFYGVLRDCFTLFMLIFIGIYFPLKIVLLNWLPNYALGLQYMGLLFPITIFESKVAMLTTVYFKALRKEKMLFIVNASALLFSFILTLIGVLFVKRLIFIVASITIVLAYQYLISEFTLSKYMKIPYQKNMLLECIFVALFIYVSVGLPEILGGLLYFVVIFGYLIIDRKNIILKGKKLIQLVIGGNTNE